MFLVGCCVRCSPRSLLNTPLADALRRRFLGVRGAKEREHGAGARTPPVVLECTWTWRHGAGVQRAGRAAGPAPALRPDPAVRGFFPVALTRGCCWLGVLRLFLRVSSGSPANDCFWLYSGSANDFCVVFLLCLCYKTACEERQLPRAAVFFSFSCKFVVFACVQGLSLAGYGFLMCVCTALPLAIFCCIARLCIPTCTHTHAH